MMLLENITVLAAFKAAGIIGAGLIAIGLALAAMGFNIATPGESLTQYKETHVVVHGEIDSAIISIDYNLTSQTTLLEAMAAGDCLDRTREQLALQKMLPVCSRLGIQK